MKKAPKTALKSRQRIRHVAWWEVRPGAAVPNTTEEEATDGDAADHTDKGASSSVSVAEVSFTSAPNIDQDVDGMLSVQAATDDDGDVTAHFYISFKP